MKIKPRLILGHDSVEKAVSLFLQVEETLFLIWLEMLGDPVSTELHLQLLVQGGMN